MSETSEPAGVVTTEPGGPVTPSSAVTSSSAGFTSRPTTTLGADTTTSTSPPPPTPARDCAPHLPAAFPEGTFGPPYNGVGISREVYSCADEVALVLRSDPAAIAAAATGDVDGPLLLVGPWLDAQIIDEVRRLAPVRIVAAGVNPGAVADALPGIEVRSVPVDPAADSGLQPPVSASRVWLVDHTETIMPLVALARQVEAAVVAVDGDLRGASAESRAVIASASEVEMLSDFDDDLLWQLEVVRRGDEIPGGGLLMFDRRAPRRLVAAYGHPVTSALGVLGEQGPEATISRIRSMAQGYDGDGHQVLPTFEIIATVASAGPGRDGNYSSETSRDVIRPWIELAAEHGVYAVLDLQPGRTDFLTQAKQYEEFLRLPHVGLALDPEWRLKPDQVHLRQIGTVDASEINQVVGWLADIVREEALPQKLMIVHQFRDSMITNRQKIATPPELAVLIQMDGQGRLDTKYSTWGALTRPSDANQFYWGWKNFYDEDYPLATPQQVLDLSPNAAFVSFQ